MMGKGLRVRRRDETLLRDFYKFALIFTTSLLKLPTPKMCRTDTQIWLGGCYGT